ncbi:hypothetical protein SAMN04487906_1822 [Zhouia amylolytica]|uniref:Uncharacterized protein n=1 Tax=Zhouia amylolytica TaxID=376730 RepID=A0A1I6T3S6_9FLAO|nr:hypothetical protein [Zhouia amylolytica]SFS83710.1 hypothetical protein SAMN04487906_1822 [Zhouia amylolytica]
MPRIYFDKQIFSHLFKQEKAKYVKLLNQIRKQKASLFCYSHAHLRDLKNDKTNIKYSELEFMDSIVNDNYLSYHAIEKKTSCYLARPLEAFADVEKENDDIDFSSIFDFDTSDLNPEDREKIENAKTLLTDTKLDFNFPEMENLDSSITTPLKNFLSFGKEPMSIMQWSEHFMGMLKNMQEDKSVYKELRNVTDKHINNGKFIIDYDEIDFNEDLKDSYLQKTFIEYVNSNLNPNGDKEISKYDFFTNAYFTLDLLGISKEPSKSVRFNNMLNDGIHSYYGAYCDCVVSDDNGFLKKTRALYKLLGIDTKVIHADEFIQSFDFIVEKEEKDQNTFSKLLVNDLKNGLIVDSYKSIDINRETVTIKPFHNYLGFFNRIDKILEDGKCYLYFYRKTNNYSNFTFIREYELVVNNAVEIFRADKYFKERFEWEKEKDLIQSNKWYGRIWEFETFTLKIETNKGSGKLSILISMK